MIEAVEPRAQHAPQRGTLRARGGDTQERGGYEDDAGPRAQFDFKQDYCFANPIPRTTLAHLVISARIWLAN